MTRSNRLPFISFAIFLLLTLVVSPLFFSKKAHAAGLTSTMVRLDRLSAATATTGTVCVTPTTASTEVDVQVVFPTGFTLGLAATFTVNTTNLDWPSGAQAWPGIGTATNVTSLTVTFPSTDLTIATLYCFNWINSAAVLTPSAANDLTGTITTRATGPAAIDTGYYATSIITNDQITVTASVPATFTFSLSANSAALGTLSSGSVSSTTAINATFSTNAAKGVVGWVGSLNGALNSAGSGATIASPGTDNGSPETLSGGTSGYVLDVNTNTNGSSGTGVVTVSAEFNGTTTSQGGHLTASNVLSEVFTTTGTHQAGIVDLVFRAAISAIQAAATDYQDVVTVVAAGRF